MRKGWNGLNAPPVYSFSILPRMYIPFSLIKTRHPFQDYISFTLSLISFLSLSTLSCPTKIISDTPCSCMWLYRDLLICCTISLSDVTLFTSCKSLRRMLITALLNFHHLLCPVLYYSLKCTKLILESPLKQYIFFLIHHPLRYSSYFRSL